MNEYLMNKGLNELRNFISRYVLLDDGEFESFLSKWKLYQLEQNNFLVKPGKTDPYFYFVIEGVQRLYFPDQKGEEHILGFSFKGNFSGDLSSFVNQRPSDFYIETLTESVFLIINFEDWKELFENIPKLHQWYGALMQDILFGRIKREIEMQTMPAEERFRVFMKRVPDQLLQIPQKYLASYLGMKPETFSRMRAKRIS